MYTPKGNQPPFVYWDSPLDESTFSSGAEIEFDASESFISMMTQ